MGRSVVLVEPFHASHGRAIATHKCRSTTVSKEKLVTWFHEVRVKIMTSCVEVADSFWRHFDRMAGVLALSVGTAITDVMQIVDDVHVTMEELEALVSGTVTGKATLFGRYPVDHLVTTGVT